MQSYTKFDESNAIVDISKWKEYSKSLVNVLCLTKEEDKNKIFGIACAYDSGNFEFSIEGELFNFFMMYLFKKFVSGTKNTILHN